MDIFKEWRTMRPKTFALARIGVNYEDVRNYANCKSMDMGELRLRVQELNARIRSLCTRYGVTGDEVQEYFTRNNYVLSF